MNSPIVDTSQLDDESGFIPEVEAWEKDSEAIPKANDFKFGVNFMNQLINISKIDYFLGSTIDESTMGESMNDETTAKSGTSKAKKTRIGSGDHQFANNKGRFKNTKNADLIEDSSQMSKSKNRTRYSSKSPFLRNNVKNKNLKPDKQNEADGDSKFGLSGKAIDKRNSTKVTQHTNSENGENSWIKGNISSNEKSKNKKTKEKRSGSMVRKQAKQSIKQKNLKSSQNPPDLNNCLEEEDKIVEEIEVHESYNNKFDDSHNSSHKKKINNNPEKEAKTDKMMNKGRKCKFL